MPTAKIGSMPFMRELNIKEADLLGLTESVANANIFTQHPVLAKASAGLFIWNIVSIG